MASVPNTNDFIASAVQRGIERGLESLTAVERIVFIISEAEVNCDMDGIDTFLDKYGSAGAAELAAAYATIGARELASALRAIVDSAPAVPEVLLDRANDYVSCRRGYAYEDIERAVASLLVERS